jgi:hypothetical protein
LQNKLKQLSTDFGHLAGELSALQSAAAENEGLSREVSALRTQIAAGSADPVSQQLSKELSEPQREVSALKTQIAPDFSGSDTKQISKEFDEPGKGISPLNAQIEPMPPPAVPFVPNGPLPPFPQNPPFPAAPFLPNAPPFPAAPILPNAPPPPFPAAAQPIPQRPPFLMLNSQIISDVPEIFGVFRGKLSLLWRGTHFGFKAKDFHRRCDGHANTLTVIVDTDGNIFGGFTPTEWESDKWGKYKGDDKGKSFLFTMRNPHHVPPKRFPLKVEEKRRAIRCDSGSGPHFGFSDIKVANNCHVNTNSCSCLGHYYVNDTGISGEKFFTGLKTFQVREIEVFEMLDSTAVPEKQKPQG